MLRKHKGFAQDRLSQRLRTQITALASIPDGIIRYRRLSSNRRETHIVLDPNNANLHSEENLDAIGKSLNAFGPLPCRRGAVRLSSSGVLKTMLPPVRLCGYPNPQRDRSAGKCPQNYRIGCRCRRTQYKPISTPQI